MALTQSFAIAPLNGLVSVPIWHGYEGAGTQAWHEGEVLVASSGTLVVGTADPTAETIVGLSLEHAAGTTSADVAYIPALPNLIFEGCLQNAAGTATIALATHMYAEFGINVTSKVWWIDTDETTHKDVVIVGFKDAIGTLNGVVYFQFKPGATIFDQAVT
jgi:hypothetical protein